MAAEGGQHREHPEWYTLDRSEHHFLLPLTPLWSSSRYTTVRDKAIDAALSKEMSTAFIVIEKVDSEPPLRAAAEQIG